MEKKEQSKYDNEFHRRYVGGQGEVEQKSLSSALEFKGISIEQILSEYRRYVGDPKAELPEDLINHLRQIGKI